MSGEQTTTTDTTHQGVSFLRHSGWVGPEDFSDPVHIVGCGAVGSHVAQLCADMGFHSFVLWDADKVEPHNLANQAFDVEHIGMYKVDALEHVLKRFNPSIKVTKHPYFFESEKHAELLEGPLVIATDSMGSRADLGEAFTLNPDVVGVYEIRLGFDYGEVHVVDNADILACTAWKDTLRPDSEVEEGPCNKRICTTLVWLASSILVHNICNRYAALRQNVPWVYQSRTGLSLADRLRTLSFNPKKS